MTSERILRYTRRRHAHEKGPALYLAPPPTLVGRGGYLRPQLFPGARDSRPGTQLGSQFQDTVRQGQDICHSPFVEYKNDAEIGKGEEGETEDEGLGPP